MLKLFTTLKSNLKRKQHPATIDNWVFQLHYRVSMLVFFIATILVSSREYIGEHIKCISDHDKSKEFQKVIETFCFFSTTFTVVNDYDIARYFEHIPYPGIMPHWLGSKQTIKKHVYYQWVPFVLFGQAIMFYVTHLLWKNFEGGRMRRVSSSLAYSNFAFLEKEVQVDSQTIPSKKKTEDCIATISNNFLERITLNNSWAKGLLFCELLNALNVIFQIYLTHKFLGDQFYTLGPDVLKKGSRILDDIFPKITKCAFHKYGPSGSIQSYDVMCIMALNIINEKIYVFLWFWFVVLFAASCLILLWRFITIALYSRCSVINQLSFGYSSHLKLHPCQLSLVTRHCSYSDWLFLKYLSKNMDGLAFKQLLKCIVDEVERRHETIMLLQRKTVDDVRLIGWVPSTV